MMCGRRLTLNEDGLCMHCDMELPRTYMAETPENNNLFNLIRGGVTIRKAGAFIYYIPHNDTANIVHTFKYFENPKAARIAGAMMGREMEVFFEGIDCLVPIPITKKRMRERGYNQSEELTRGIQEITDIPIVTNALERTNFSISQTKLSEEERLKNIINVFHLTRHADKLAGKHILLVDDIITTGATISECAKELQKIEGTTISILAFGSSRR